MQAKRLTIISIIFEAMLTVCGFTIERHMLLFAPLSDGNKTIVLEVLSNGQIIDTGQQLNTGYGGNYGGASPDEQSILIPTSYQISQYYIAPTGAVSLVTTYPFGAWQIAYHPNGRMVISTDTTIFRVRENGLLEVANFYSRPAGNLWISPVGNITVGGDTSSTISAYRIDTTNYTVTTSQWIFINGTAQEAGYMPDGSQLLVVEYSNEAYRDVDIFQVTPDGTVVDTTVQHLDLVNTNGAKSIAMSYDGQYAFVITSVSNGVIATISRISTGQWIDTGGRISIRNPFRIRMAPTYNMLVVQHDISGSIYQYLSTYFVGADGNLTATGYTFPFQQTFGDVPVDLVFAYPPGVTTVDSSNWQLYE